MGAAHHGGGNRNIVTRIVPGQDEVALVVFRLEGQRYAVYLASVERVLPMVAVTPLPVAPDIVIGVIVLEGRVIPVVNLRRRFRLPERPAELSDQLLIADTGRRTVALCVDTVYGIVERSEDEFVPADTALPGLVHLEGFVTLPDGLVLIQDLNLCLSLEEEEQLNQAMQDAASHPSDRGQ